METRWLYKTSSNFAALREESKNVCVIPMGCVEKHGLHLPLGTDILHASHIAYLASQVEPVCIFPPSPYVLTEQGPFPLLLGATNLALPGGHAQPLLQGHKAVAIPP